MRASVSAHSRGNLWQDSLVAFCCSWLVALLAQVSLPCPFSPVPFTLGPHALLTCISNMSTRRGILLACFYFSEGLLGFPVFSAPPYSLAIFFGPRGGYLLGCLLASCVLGRLSSYSFIGRMCLGTCIVYGCGVWGLSHFMDGITAFRLGVLPFVAIDALKIVFSGALLQYALGEQSM